MKAYKRVYLLHLSQEDEENIDKIHKTKMSIKEDEIVVGKSLPLEVLFGNLKSKEERDSAVAEAFKEGYRQSEIAKFLGLSLSLISKVIKIQDLISDPILWVFWDFGFLG